MGMMGYQAGIVASKRIVAMPILAVAFASVIVLIASLDRPIGGFTFTEVSQQPMIGSLIRMVRHRTSFFSPVGFSVFC